MLSPSRVLQQSAGGDKYYRACMMRERLAGAFSFFAFRG